MVERPKLPGGEQYTFDSLFQNQDDPYRNGWNISDSRVDESFRDRLLEVE
jgi:hypothetical protein